jgi:hypothetical protein
MTGRNVSCWVTSEPDACARQPNIAAMTIPNRHRRARGAAPRSPIAVRFRGRDASYLAPAAQIRTCGFPAYGSHLGCGRQHAAVCKPTPCVTLIRLCVRHVLSWPAFPLVPALGSTNSAADRSALFVGFPATMAESDFSGPCIIGYGSSPSRCGPATAAPSRSNPRSPSFRCDPFARDVALDPDRASAPRIAVPHMLPSSE